VFDNGVLALHFYTLNLEKSVNEVLKTLDFKMRSPERKLPWKDSHNPKRDSENVRPVFWKNKSKSYISKTWYWDEYPNGMWGDSRSPAFGDITEHFNSFCHKHIDIDSLDQKKFKPLRKICV
jgi:methylenetetrahydrofolate reductase (NADPH)